VAPFSKSVAVRPYGNFSVQCPFKILSFVGVFGSGRIL
jgi:hypothetical protein